MPQCPINPRRSHTEKFEKIHSALHDELLKRNISGVDDVEELSMALAVLVADSLEIDVYE
ncbi:MAG: hypothetical protein IT388_10575 [Nitrospirales bacterium]|nr:hypothetical protein [Nitrospirales bacterium]